MVGHIGRQDLNIQVIDELHLQPHEVPQGALDPAPAQVEVPEQDPQPHMLQTGCAKVMVFLGMRGTNMLPSGCIGQVSSKIMQHLGF